MNPLADDLFSLVAKAWRKAEPKYRARMLDSVCYVYSAETMARLLSHVGVRVAEDDKAAVVAALRLHWPDLVNAATPEA